MQRNIQVEVVLGEAILASTCYNRQDKFVWISTKRIMRIFGCSRSNASRIMDAVVRTYATCFYLHYDREKGRKLLMWIPNELWYVVAWNIGDILATRKRIDTHLPRAKFSKKDYLDCIAWHNAHVDEHTTLTESEQTQ